MVAPPLIPLQITVQTLYTPSIITPKLRAKPRSIVMGDDSVLSGGEIVPNVMLTLKDSFSVEPTKPTEGA